MIKKLLFALPILITELSQHQTLATLITVVLHSLTTMLFFTGLKEFMEMFFLNILKVKLEEILSNSMFMILEEEELNNGDLLNLMDLLKILMFSLFHLQSKLFATNQNKLLKKI